MQLPFLFFFILGGGGERDSESFVIGVYLTILKITVPSNSGINILDAKKETKMCEVLMYLIS